jgi:hypothetical protein
MAASLRSTPLRYRLWVPALALWIAAPLVQASDAAVAVAVRPTVSFAGGEVRAIVRTPRDARNRELRVVVEAAEYYSSSDVQLDGDEAPATHQFSWKALPGGNYRVEAILLRDDGEERRVAGCFAVLGEDQSRGEPGRRMAPVEPVPGACTAGTN